MVTRRLRDHLEPGGELVASFMKLRKGDQPLSFDWIPNGKATRSDGSLVRRFMRSTLDRETQLESIEERYELLVDGEVVRTEDHHRSTVRECTLDQAIALYEGAGLANVHATDGFTFDPATTDSHIFCLHGSA